MPIFVSGGGGGGFGSGNRYPTGNVKNIDISEKNNTFYLTWEDPEDISMNGESLSKWKGTIVVKNGDHAPVSKNDGMVIADSQERNKYKENGLNLGQDAGGNYYGVFPYTNTYIYNTNEANVIYLPTGGFNGSLEDATWRDVIWASDNGKASEMWKEGEKIKLQLRGESYNLDVNMMIVGFNHDDLIEGGKANITFMSDEIIGYSQIRKQVPYGNSPFKNISESLIQTDVYPKILSCMPEIVVENIKKVYKKRLDSYIGGSGYNKSIINMEQTLFGFSAYELCSEDDIPAIAEYNLYEGEKYPYFSTDGDNKRKRTNVASVSGDTTWWIDSGIFSRADLSSGGMSFCSYVFSDGSFYKDFGNTTSNVTENRGIIFGFCI